MKADHLAGALVRAFVYNRKDGGTTYCYGRIDEDSNFSIVCDNELMDGVWTDNEDLKTWLQVCKYLEKHYYPKIEEISSC